MSKRTDIQEKSAAAEAALNELHRAIEALGKNPFFRHWPSTINNLERTINSSLKKMLIIADSMLKKEEKDHEL